MQDYLLKLVPVIKTEIAYSFNMTYHTLWRKIKHLDIPPSKVIPKNVIKICDCCGMSVERVIEHIDKHNLCA